MKTYLFDAQPVTKGKPSTIEFTEESAYTLACRSHPLYILGFSSAGAPLFHARTRRPCTLLGSMQDQINETGDTPRQVRPFLECISLYWKHCINSFVALGNMKIDLTEAAE
jgi:hypothetical protein